MNDGPETDETIQGRIDAARCDRCVYWAQHGKSNKGGCRINAPTVIICQEIPTVFFPGTTGLEYCGKFEPGKGRVL